MGAKSVASNKENKIQRVCIFIIVFSYQVSIVIHNINLSILKYLGEFMLSQIIAMTHHSESLTSLHIMYELVMPIFEHRTGNQKEGMGVS